MHASTISKMKALLTECADRFEFTTVDWVEEHVSSSDLEPERKLAIRIRALLAKIKDTQR